MWLPVPAQTALISAVTAAAVTLLVEYAAKPRLEVRKDRIVEQHRARRLMLARLITLPNDFFGISGLSYPGLAWAVGKLALEAVSEECGQLSYELAKFSPGLGKLQRRVAERYMLSIPGRIQVLAYIVALHEKTGIIAQETRRLSPETKLPMAPLIEKVFYVLLEDTMGAYTALVQSRGRPWSYFRRLRKLASHQAKVHQELKEYSLSDDHAA